MHPLPIAIGLGLLVGLNGCSIILDQRAAKLQEEKQRALQAQLQAQREAAEKRRAEEEQQQAERDARRKAAAKAITDSVPCKIAVFSGYATGLYNYFEFTMDAQVMSDMASIKPLSCRRSIYGGSECYGFYSGYQLVGSRNVSG
ncbi:MAG: DNA-binding protein [Chromatiales bacterium]|nr:DNA-binding protein [Chromatiales bacterium]